MIIDILTKPLSEGYEIYVIKSGGEVKRVGTHYPWFAVFVPKVRLNEAIKVIESKVPKVVKAEESDRTPLIPGEVRHEPRLDYGTINVYSERKEFVPNQALTATKLLSTFGGVYNIVYGVRCSFDLNIKYFHEKCPLIFQPNNELEGLFKDVLASTANLKVLAFDIEVYTKGGKFPKPGDPVISVQFAVTKLFDPDFFDKSWAKNNVVVETAGTLSDSEEVIAKFLKYVSKVKPDIIVGYNSKWFDVKYIKPFLANAEDVFPDLNHVVTNGKAYPHIDMIEVVQYLGTSLGIRAHKVFALHDVVKEVAKEDKRLSWLINSPLMVAEEKLDHTKLSSEWLRRTELFTNYCIADVYLTLVLSRLWLPTLILLSSLTQVPLTIVSRLNLGQLSEYNLVNWLEKLGFEPAVLTREKEFKKVTSLGVMEKYVPNEWKEIFKKGKVYVKNYGVFTNVGEFDFAQMYPTLMSVETLDPTGLRIKQKITVSEPIKVITYADPLFTSKQFKLSSKAVPTLIGVQASKTADFMIPTDLYYVVSTYGPVSFLINKMFFVRKISKKLKKYGGGEFKAIDQSVKILNNATYGGFSKKRGWINQVLSAYVFWVTLKMMYDVIKYAESKGMEVTYGDTDSLFIICKLDYNKCVNWFNNEVLPTLNKYVKSKFGKEFELEFKHSYGACIYPKLKYGSTASRKTYICCDSNMKVAVFKGDFYKTLAPTGVKERLDSFYELIIKLKPRTSKDVEEILMEFIKELPTYKMFVRKTVEDFKTTQSVKESKKVIDKIKNLNKSWHYASLHLSLIWSLPGVEVISKKEVGDSTYVTYRVDANKVFSMGPLQPMFLPSNDPKNFIMFVEDRGDEVRVHEVKVKNVKKIVKHENGGAKEVGYEVSEVYRDEWLKKNEVINLAVESMRKYIIDDITRKLLPAINKRESVLTKWYL